MFECPICKEKCENLNIYQRHFGFKNLYDKLHVEYKNKQIKIAEDLFNTDKSGDTFHILEVHPEINLISEKLLRKIWLDRYGRDSIEKRRAEISFNKNNSNRYEPARLKKLEGKDKKCPVCDFMYTGIRTLSHHISMLKDDVHTKFFNEQRKVAERLFLEDREHNTFELLKLHPEFQLSEAVLRNRFWREKYGKNEMWKRHYGVSSKSRKGILPWNDGLTKENDKRLKSSADKISINHKKGNYNKAYKNQSNIWKRKYKTGEKICPMKNPLSRKKVSQTLLDGHSSGRIKPSHGKGGFREDIQMSVRSTWEANFVRILRLLQIPFLYESKVFTFYDKDGSIIDTYLPDFYLKGRYYEIKGIFPSSKDWTVHPSFQDNVDRINLFKEHYPKEYKKLHIIGKKEYAKIKNKFSKRIENWEK